MYDTYTRERSDCFCTLLASMADKVATFSGQVRDACSSMMSSVRSDVLDTLVCLVSTRSGKKADIKLGSRPDSTEVGMAEVHTISTSSAFRYRW